MDEYLILVDENDNEIGYEQKLKVHTERLLHRAFSIFIFDWRSHKMLLQKRASSKYHSGGLWSNACCSHPRRGQSMEAALSSRLRDELGLETTLKIADPRQYGLLLDGEDTIYSCGQFLYHADFGDLGEHELDHVFLYSPEFGGFDQADFHVNPAEIEDLRWVTISELQDWLSQSPGDFSAWFQPAFELAYEVLKQQARDKDFFFGFGR